MNIFHTPLVLMSAPDYYPGEPVYHPPPHHHEEVTQLRLQLEENRSRSRMLYELFTLTLLCLIGLLACAVVMYVPHEPPLHDNLDRAVLIKYMQVMKTDVPQMLSIGMGTSNSSLLQPLVDAGVVESVDAGRYMIRDAIQHIVSSTLHQFDVNSFDGYLVNSPPNQMTVSRKEWLLLEAYTRLSSLAIPG